MVRGTGKIPLEVIKNMYKLFLGFILCVVLSACGSTVEFGCTTEFVIYSLTVVDEEGVPVLLDSIMVTNLETGEMYPDCNADLSNFPCLELTATEDAPSYEVMNDSFNDLLKRSGTRVLAEGAKGDSSFKEEYVFRSGECHVEIESGSLEITLE